MPILVIQLLTTSRPSAYQTARSARLLAPSEHRGSFNSLCVILSNDLLALSELGATPTIAPTFLYTPCSWRPVCRAPASAAAWPSFASSRQIHNPSFSCILFQRSLQHVRRPTHPSSSARFRIP